MLSCELRLSATSVASGQRACATPLQARKQRVQAPPVRHCKWRTAHGSRRVAIRVARNKEDLTAVLPGSQSHDGATQGATTAPNGPSMRVERDCGSAASTLLEAENHSISGGEDVVASSAGLLGMPGWKRPEDLDPWVDGVVCRLGQLRSAMQACTPGLPFLALLHDHELLLRNALRPARYVADFHPMASWRAAAGAAAARLDVAAALLYDTAVVYDILAATQAALVQVVGDGTSTGEARDPQLEARILADLGRHCALRAAGPGQWLQLCRVVRPLFHRRHHRRSRGRRHSPGALQVATAAALGSSDRTLLRCDHAAAPWTATSPVTDGGQNDNDGGLAATSMSHDVYDSVEGGVSPPALAPLQAAVVQCDEVLRRLAAGRPPLAPRLALHPAQLEVLRPWLPARPDGGEAVEWLSRRQWQELYGKDAAEGGLRDCGVDGSGSSSSSSHGGGSTAGVGNTGTQSPPPEQDDGRRLSRRRRQRRLLTLYDGAEPLDLDELLLDATDEALELVASTAAPHTNSYSTKAAGAAATGDSGGGHGASEGGGSGPGSGREPKDGGDGDGGEAEEPLVALVDLTPEVSGRLLQLHPNEGVRWQVYHSGTLRQARALLMVLDHLTALRRQLAEALGASSWAELVLQGGGSAGGGGGGGSALGSSTAVVRMLRELGAGLVPYGESELQAITRDAGRLRSRSGTALPAGSDPLDPWNLPYVLQGLAQGQATSRYDGGWSVSYADYFAPPGLLKGTDALCRAMFGIGLVGPLEVAPGEAAGWVYEEGLQPGANRGEVKGLARRAADDSGSLEAGRQGYPHDPSEQATGGLKGQRAVKAGGGGDGGNDVVLKAAVVCCRTKRDLGVLYLHLHGNLSEYPFTTLLHHGPASGWDGGADEDTVSQRGQQDLELPASAANPVSEPAAPSVAVDAGEGSSRGLPHVLVRLPYRPDGRSECGGPESPYFLKAWLHELGHALHYVASAAACGITTASETLLGPPSPPPPPQEQLGSPGPPGLATAAGAEGSGTGTGAGTSAASGGAESPGTGGAGRAASDRQLALLSGAASPLDVREVASHLMEHALREPGCVRLLSRHCRLDCPLPQRDCARLVSQLSMCFTSTVGELQSLVAAALADQLMHGPRQLHPRPSTPSPPPQHLPLPAQPDLQQPSATTTSPGAVRTQQAVPEPAAAPAVAGTGAAALMAGAACTAADVVPSLAAAAAEARRRPAWQAHLDAHVAVCSLTAYHYQQAMAEEEGDVEAVAAMQRASARLSAGNLVPAPPPPPPPLLVPGPDRLHHLEALAVVGGGKYVYVASRLFAAAAWRKYLQGHLAQKRERAEEPPAGVWSQQHPRHESGPGKERDSDHLPAQGRDRGLEDGIGGGSADKRVSSGGLLVRRRLLEAGAHGLGIEVLRSLLGHEAFVKCGPVTARDLNSGDAGWHKVAGSSGGGVGAGRNRGLNASECMMSADAADASGCLEGAGLDGRRKEGQDALGIVFGGAELARGEEGVGWVVDLGAEVFQDVDLLG